MAALGVGGFLAYRNAKPSVSAPVTSPSPSKSAPPLDGAFVIYNLATDMCVDLDGVDGGAPSKPVVQDACIKDADDNQEFRFEPRGGGLYRIRNTKDDLCLDVPGDGAVAEGSDISEMDCLDNDNQDYRLQPRFTSGGRQYYWIVNDVTGMCLDVSGFGDGGPAARLTLAQCVTGNDHEWALVRKADL